MTIVIDAAAWSWFEDERAQMGAAGGRRYASAVTGSHSTGMAPGTVVLAEVELLDATRARACSTGMSPRPPTSDGASGLSPSGR